MNEPALIERATRAVADLGAAQERLAGVFRGIREALTAERCAWCPNTVAPLPADAVSDPVVARYGRLCEVCATKQELSREMEEC